jgi:hypothetical protein
MPERWQSELEKVDLLEPAEDLQDRIGHVSTVERRESPGRRIVVGLIALAIFVAAGAFGFAAFRPRPETTPTPASPSDIHVSSQTFDFGLRFPQGVVAEAGSVWVAGSNGEPWNGRLVRLDPQSGEVQATIDVPVQSSLGGAGVASGLGSVWILAGGDKATANGGTWLYRIDPNTNEIADASELTTSEYPIELAVDQSGIWVLSLDPSAGEGEASQILRRVDPISLDVATTLRVVPFSWSENVMVSGGTPWVVGGYMGPNNVVPGPVALAQVNPNGSTVGVSAPGHGDAFTMVASADRLWFEHDGVRAIDATNATRDIGPVELSAVAERSDGCCSDLVPDGVGGVWALGDKSADGPEGLWHLNVDGSVTAASADALGPHAEGLASTFDPSTGSIWIVRGDGFLTQLSITPARGFGLG